MPEETPAQQPAEVKPVASAVDDAAVATGDAADTATHAGEDAIAQALGRIEGTLNEIKASIGAPSVTQGAEVAAKPVAPAEETAEAVAPEVRVRPRKPHWLNSLPRFL